MINLDYIIISVLGLLLGSFLNICIYQIPKGEIIIFPPPHYSHYRDALSPMQLTPVASFRFLKKRCRHSRKKINAQYFLVEILVSILFLLMNHQYGYHIRGLAAAVLICTVITASFIDLKHRIIPNTLNLFIAITGVFFMLTGGTVTIKQSLLGFVIGGGILLSLGLFASVILKKEGMGGGDIKLAAACGLYLGIEKMIAAFIITAYIAGFILLVLLVAKKIKKDQYIPFAPFLSAGVITVILFFDKFIKVIIRN